MAFVDWFIAYNYFMTLIFYSLDIVNTNMSFLGFGKSPDPSSSFGYNIEKTDSAATMNNVKSRMAVNTTKYIGELNKYREVAEFNKKISKSYVANLTVMVDVSKMLNMYVETIEFIKSQIKRAEDALGRPLDVGDLDHLTMLTKNNISVLYNQFIGETDKLKRLFKDNPEYRAQTESINRAQSEIAPLSEGADSIFMRVEGEKAAVASRIASNVASAGPVARPPGTFGGSKKKTTTVAATKKTQKSRKTENRKSKK